VKARRRRRGDDLRAEDQPEGTNLAAVDLTDAELTNANLSSVDLYTSYLNSATLTAANLSNAKLNHAELKGADLRRANLWKADLQGAYLWGAVGITNEHLEQQASSLKGATMSDSHKYEDWLKDRGGRKEDGENE
jgi:uncharacterized protein YjbI with pentapeptide repeats